MPSLEAQLLLKAAATATDQGSFTAIAAAYTLDRDMERIRPGAFANTIKAWQDRNRPIPLHWAHQGGPENVIGSVDPAAMRETDDGLYVEGTLDLEGSEMAKEAWRLVKADTVSLSFGFLGEVTPTAKDGTREITNIDLYEVSLTPAPANPDTHFLSVKDVDMDRVRQLEEELVAVKGQLAAAGEELDAYRKRVEETDGQPEAGSVDPLRERAQEVELELRSAGLGSLKPPKVKEQPKPQPEFELGELKARSRDLMLELLSGIEREP